MGDIREKAWAFPIVGGIIALIALLTPTAYLSEYLGSMYVWMWGLLSVQLYGYGSNTQFTEEPGELMISIICTIIVLISIIAMLASGSSNKKFRATAKSWVAPSVFLMIGTIIYIVGLEINTYNIGGFSFWSNINPGFGVIGMFLGGIVSLIGYGVSKMSPRQATDIFVAKKTEFMRSEKEIHPTPSSIFKFCPMCGYKIVKTDQKFCVNCGFQFVTEPEGKVESLSSEIRQKPELKLITIPPDTEEGKEIKVDCKNCNLSRKLGRQECIWCGKTL